MKKLWLKCKAFIRWILKQLKDKTNILIFIIVFLVLSSEVWIPYLLAIITGNKWWWGIGSLDVLACTVYTVSSAMSCNNFRRSENRRQNSR